MIKKNLFMEKLGKKAKIYQKLISKKEILFWSNLIDT